jgi:hypothetical protein
MQGMSIAPLDAGDMRIRMRHQSIVPCRDPVEVWHVCFNNYNIIASQLAVKDDASVGKLISLACGNGWNWCIKENTLSLVY